MGFVLQIEDQDVFKHNISYTTYRGVKRQRGLFARPVIFMGD
jgi:hypothetical protein